MITSKYSKRNEIFVAVLALVFGLFSAITTQAQISNSDYPRMVLQIVNALQPGFGERAIVRFGNAVIKRGCGYEVENKSFDLPQSRLNEIRRIRQALSSFRVPKDILVYNGEEVEKWRNSINHIIGRCVQEGRLLYERLDYDTHDLDRTQTLKDVTEVVDFVDTLIAKKQ